MLHIFLQSCSILDNLSYLMGIFICMPNIGKRPVIKAQGQLAT
jgi:hypothetical protein